MHLENRFTVDASVDRAWDLLMDVPRVVPCVPGAQLVEQAGEECWVARMRVKLGPMNMVFDADVHRRDIDLAGRSVVLDVKAREQRGRGGATAMVASRLTASDAGTEVTVVTELGLSGRVAQFGRAAAADVAAEMTARFADGLREELEREQPSDAPAGPDPGPGVAAALPAPAQAAPRPAQPGVSAVRLLLRAAWRSVRRMAGRRRSVAS
jgi:uncharacterized protein